MLKNKLKKIFSRKQAGFTLIEMLVVIFIIAILSALLFANYKTGQKKYTLIQASQQAVSNIRKAQNMAISGTDIVGTSYYGFGVFFNRNDNYYIIYADKNGNSSYQPSDDSMIETINLAGKVIINSTSPVASKLDVFFESPNPTTYINGSSADGLTGTVTFTFEGTSLTKTVTITTAGLIQGN
jgi:prepilin-type N-terminal cleavage/methylation domain-containing protein